MGMSSISFNIVQGNWVRDRLTDLRSQSGNGGLQILFLLPVLLVLLFPAGENRKEPS